ncbi:hypothetical protein EG328_007898 [Venturia inaequalis]|uniref:BTB domain-containing protein n=1 Tax=Venturia inaequalis TaxID=5025 RepID=A0A8H3UED9_VENIN|nr:hypothetical protein EG328_007898 [Venturia inaequalis]
MEAEFSVPSTEDLKDPALVTVEIGSEKTQFKVMKWILCHHSKYFRKAFSFDGIEAKSGKITLEDVDETIFQHFLRYIYLRKFPYHIANCAKIDVGKLVGNLEEAARLFIFAEIYDVIELRRHCVQVFILTEKNDVWVSKRGDLSILSLVFNNVPETSSLYRLIADIEIYNLILKTEEETRIWMETVPKSLAVRKLFLESHGYRRMGHVLYSCDYHDHDSDADRENCPIADEIF